jgi:tRNA pseudouridine55 synthase
MATGAKKVSKITKEGLYGVYKPIGPTSHHVVAAIRNGLSSGIKVGHAGTLDPLASGVLVIAVGRKYTKQIGKIVDKEKEYIAKVTLGQVSSTDDMEGERVEHKIFKKPSRTDIELALKFFEGEILQVPPVFSAIKINGKASYKMARRGQPVSLLARKVQLKSSKILSYRWPNVKIKLVTGPGFYVRALARDLGEKLGAGAFLSALERTRVGQYKKEQAMKIVLKNKFSKVLV